MGQTIRDLKQAGIQLWVLTGDKVETAINIGYSCELLNNEMNMFLIQEQKSRRIHEEIVKAIAKQKVTHKQRQNSVVVAGDTLFKIQAN